MAVTRGALYTYAARQSVGALLAGLTKWSMEDHMAEAQSASNPDSLQPARACKSCGSEKSPSEFYASSPRTCKECVKSRVRARARTSSAVQEYDRARAKRPERRQKAREVTLKWRAENPQGYKAQTAVGNAVRDGKLKKLPCLFCGAAEVHAHHRDYTKPLDVVWLCPRCHHRLHAAFPETEGSRG